MQSIISNERECLVCKTPYNLHRHHVFFGAGNRKLSEKHGCWCYLCARHHNMSDGGVHFYKELDLKLKRICQKKWEDQNGTRDDFRRIFGRSWL